MSENKQTTKVKIPCRISFANIWEPKSINGSDEKYSVSCIISKKDTKTISAINAAIEAAKEAGKVKKWGGKIPAGPGFKLTLRDGDIERSEDYFLVAALFGGNYIFIYTMTDHSLTVNQPAGQAARSMAIGAFTSAAGAVGGNPGVMMAGLAARGNQITSSEFDKILSLKIDPPAGEIRIHSFLTWYSIYVGPDDFAFVAEYLRTRCKNAAISE